MAALVAPPSLGRKRPRKQTARQSRIAAVHNVAKGCGLRKRFFALQHCAHATRSSPWHATPVFRHGGLTLYRRPNLTPAGRRVRARQRSAVLANRGFCSHWLPMSRTDGKGRKISGGAACSAVTLRLPSQKPPTGRRFETRQSRTVWRTVTKLKARFGHSARGSSETSVIENSQPLFACPDWLAGTVSTTFHWRARRSGL
jgi:hypothetical protein